jgi:HAD superfamily hydrolase (TIGR01509 family)
MLRAIVFDFNGVILDDEDLHFMAFQEVFSNEGITLTKKEYYDRFLAFDDRTCIKVMLARRNKRGTRSATMRLRQAKSKAYDSLLHTHLRLFPGAIELIQRCSRHYPLAIASGALQKEIHFILKKFDLERYFSAVVSADDVVHGKPHPETFLRAWRALNRSPFIRGKRIRKEECLVIEDSLHGIEAAHLAGMQCAAVAHSYPLRRLSHAEYSVRNVKDLRLSRMEALFLER